MAPRNLEGLPCADGLSLFFFLVAAFPFGGHSADSASGDALKLNGAATLRYIKARWIWTSSSASSSFTTTPSCSGSCRSIRMALRAR